MSRSEDQPEDPMATLPTRLTDGDLVLTRVCPTACDAVLEAVRASIDGLHRWQPWCPRDYDRDDAMAWACRSWLGWLDGTDHGFLIRHTDDGRVWGSVGLNQIAGGQANLGYWVRTDVTGRGVCTRAARLVARFGFDHVGLRRIHLHHHVDNHGSRRVAEKVGFVREGLHRQVAMLHGEPVDAVFYSLLGSHEVTA
jgi:RimJ/RimL family protein N-acetyltransferase